MPEITDCPLRLMVTRAEVRHPDTGDWTPVEFDQRNQTAEGLVLGAMMRALDSGDLSPLRKPPTTTPRHPAHCPLCSLRALPGPHLWGRWLTRAWHGYPTWAGDRHPTRDLEDCGPADHARLQMQQRLDALTRQCGDRPGPTSTATILSLHARPDKPAFGRRLVTSDSQLWLWDTRPAGWWPDQALVFADSRVVQVPGEEITRRYHAGEVPSGVAGEPAAPATSEGTIELDGATIRITPAAPRVVSILDHNSAAAARRVLGDGTIEPLPGCPRGLTVYGTHHGDRPHLGDIARLTPEYQHLAEGIGDGHGWPPDHGRRRTPTTL